MARMVIIFSFIFAADVHAQDYPTRPIRILAAGVGSGGDFDARQIGQGITGVLGQPIVVDNRANGAVAAEVAAKSPPDGYTLLIAGGTLWVTRLLQPIDSRHARAGNGVTGRCGSFVVSFP